MTKNELLTIVTFAERGRALSNECLGINEATWNMVLFVMRRHLENKLVTVTSLAQAADIPYTTAVRKIDHMLEEGLIIKRARTSTGKSFSLHPSCELITRFHSYALSVKELVAGTFGFPADAPDRTSYYFGASYLAANIIPGPAVLQDGIGVDNTIRFLINDDQTFLILQRTQRDIEQWLGGHVELTVVSLDRLHELTVENARREVSAYDVVDFDLPWLGEYAEKSILRSLDDLIERADMNPADFQPAGWEASRFNGTQYGIPIEPTPELLFYRRDLLEELDLEAPQTTDELLRALSVLKRKRPDIAGLTFCGARGTPIAHTFVQLMGDFGRAPLNLPTVDGDFDLSRVEGEHMRPMLDTPEALAAAEYLLELRDYAPADILDMAWDRAVQCYADGQAAMTYAWSGRAARFDFNLDSPAYRTSGCLPHPAGTSRPSMSPMGGYALGIPGNIAPERVDVAWRVIRYLTSPELVKFYVQNGCLVSPRFSVSADPEVRNISGIIETVDNLAQEGRLKFWPRPPIPEFNDMTAILGTEMHGMMKGEWSPAEALARSQSRIDEMMRAHGRY